MRIWALRGFAKTTAVRNFFLKAMRPRSLAGFQQAA
jgi:hypothetical protein